MSVSCSVKTRMTKKNEFDNILMQTQMATHTAVSLVGSIHQATFVRFTSNVFPKSTETAAASQMI